MPAADPSGDQQSLGKLYIGTAAWTYRTSDAERFGPGDSQLARYAKRLPAVEINSSFYRPHRPVTYARWGATVGEAFRFSVKIPKAITHDARLNVTGDVLDAFLEQCTSLGERLGCLLVQLPPKLQFEVDVATRFFETLRNKTATPVVCEPRHATWFADEVNELWQHYQIARVAADPAPIVGSDQPAGWSRLVYYRLHGSPRMYYSNYDDAYLDELAARLAAHRAAGQDCWCIFDNTAEGAATRNALDLATRLTIPTTLAP